MGEQKTQQIPEHATKPHEKGAVKTAQTVEATAYSTDTHILSRLSRAASLPPVPGKGLAHPTATAHQAAMLRTLQRQQGNAFVQRAVVQGHSSAGIPDHAVKQAQSDLSPGQSLDSSVQADMETGFGQDFSGVRVHTDGRANELAQGIHAQAFTRGQDIYFGAGRYQPGTPQGKHLLAHELTHTIQQRQGPSLARSATVSDSDEPMEREAEAIASHVVNSWPAPVKAISVLGSDRQGLVARDEVPQAPEKQSVDMIVVNNAVDIIIKGLKGITTKTDSANILAQFQGQNATMVSAIMQELKNRGSQNGKSSEEMVGWLFGDMTAEDSRALRQLLIGLGVIGDMARIEAALVVDRLKGYTSDEDSQEILIALTEFKGASLDEVLIQLENQMGKSKDQMSDWLFGDMERGNSEQLRQYFFQFGAVRATYYAVARTTSKIMALLSGYTSHADSSSIVWNFEHTPEEYRQVVQGLLDKRTRAERSQPVGDALMHDMDQSDYETLRGMPGLTLPAYRDTRSTLTKIVSGLEWAEIAVEVLAGGVVGVITGIISVLGDLVIGVKDIAVAAKHLVMSFLYLASWGVIGSEDWLAVKDFFSGLKGLSDPGALLKQAWEDMKLESSTIEGPFEYGRRAEFWVRKVINLIGNVALIAVAGYGLVKVGVEAVTEVANLIDKFGIIGGLARAGRQALRAVGKLITLPFKEARKLLALLRKPFQTLTAIGQKINVVRLAIEDQGLWAFLRGRAGALAEHEKNFWERQKKAWQERATTKQKQHGDLLNEANTIQDELEQNQAPPSPVENVKGIDDEADQLMKDVDQLEDDVIGKKEQETSDEQVEPRKTEAITLKKPTAEQYKQIDRYVEAMAQLNDAMASDNAEGIEKAKQILDEIENQALDQAVHQNDDSLWRHIENLANERKNIETKTPSFPIHDTSGGREWIEGIGRRIECDSTKVGPLRGKTYTEIETRIRGMGSVLQEPSGSVPAAKGELPSGAVRLTWKFTDGSFIFIDVPGSGNLSEFELNRIPHLARTAPSSLTGGGPLLELSDTGIGVPARSTPSHTEFIPDGLLKQRILGK